MKKTALAAVLAIAALSASACTGGTRGPPDTERAAGATPAPMVATSAPAVPSTAPASSAPTSSAPTSSAPSPTAPGLTSPDYERQGYADGAIDRWLSSQGAHSLAGFNEPFSFITHWASPDSDTLALVVDNAVEDYAAQKGGDVTEDLRMIGANLIVVVNAGNHQVSKVRVATADGKHSTVVRYDEPPVTAN